MSVGEYGRRGERVPGRFRESDRQYGHGPVAQQQPLLTAAQIEAIRLSIGSHVTFAGTVDDPALKATFTTAAVTLQGMLDDDARAKTR